MTLKSLHAYLRLLENSSELKRKMPAAATQRTLGEGLSEMSKLVGLDPAAFSNPQAFTALIGSSRFVMIWGEPSLGDHVAHVFDRSRVLWSVLIDPGHFGMAPMTQTGLTDANGFPASASSVAPPDSLRPLLAGNLSVSSRLFRALFEHMLAFTSPEIARQGNAVLVSELTGSRNHSRSFLSTALFILGAEVDHEQLVFFMMEQGLFCMPILEHMLQGRNVCDANYAFRRLERAFIGSPADEEILIRDRIDKFMAQFGGKPCGAKFLQAQELDKARVDACLAATDLLEALSLTPWGLTLKNAIALASSNCVRSIQTIARHFERFAEGKETKEQANQEIADHLLAFARQFSADSPASSGA